MNTVSIGKRSSKNRKKCCGFIHHRQMHAHKWSNKMNSRLKTGCEHGFPIAGDETWLSFCRTKLFGEDEDFNANLPYIVECKNSIALENWYVMSIPMDRLNSNDYFFLEFAIRIKWSFWLFNYLITYNHLRRLKKSAIFLFSDQYLVFSLSNGMDVRSQFNTQYLFIRNGDNTY